MFIRVRSLTVTYLKLLLTQIIFSFILFSSSIAMANNHNWEWFNADDNFGRYVDTQSIQVTKSKYTNTIENVEAWVKIVYSYQGAVIEVDSFKDEIGKRIDPSKLAFSLVRVNLNPQYNVLVRKQTVFYSKDGDCLGSADNPLKVYVDTNAYYGNFYYRIMDIVAKRNDLKTFTDDSYWEMIGQNKPGESKYQLALDLLSIRDEGGSYITVDKYFFEQKSDGSYSLIIDRESHNKYKPEWKSRIIYIGDNDGLNNDAGYRPEKLHVAVPGSVGEYAHNFVLKYAKENPDFINRYKRL